jgi:hypothetical protein
LGFLTVIHPFHPLCGRRLPVLFVNKRASRVVYVCQADIAGARRSRLRRLGPHGPYAYLSSAGGGAARLGYVPNEQVEAVTRRLSATAAPHALLAEISAINTELLARRELD